MEVTGDDPPLILHGKGCTEGLAAGGGAEIQHLLPRLYAGNQGYQPGSGVLHQHLPVSERFQRGQISDPGQLQTAGNPWMGNRRNAPAAQFPDQALRVCFQRVHLHRQRRRAVIGL